ncbi:MAG: membrane protein of unknown function [Promethearchaeota archaeon]|nr:MAG: membrane protein of unknown function [Candidatus Lokiarchaeota archaeon]
MVYIENYNKYIWLLPFIGGILGVIAAVTPAAQLIEPGDNIIFWYFPLNIDIEDSIIFINDSFIALLGGILELLVITLFSTILLTTSLLVWKRKWKIKKIKLLWFISALFLILAPTLFWIIGSITQDFWSNVFPSIGMIVPYIGAVLTILAIFLQENY